ncbi:MAG: PKD domain-containing protein, partial [Bacteroidota bacterium]|nr:PKD domain-containing protein [Bacteroidota bacterium]
TLDPVTGLRYEQLGDLSRPVFAYAKYTLLTDYFYRPRQEVTIQFVTGGTNSQSSIGYGYNSQGWLAAKTLQGSDNVVTRTRYKYLSDYAFPTSGATGELLAMSTRVGEGISADPVETISEIRPAGSSGHVAYAGATLQAFATSTVPDANGQPVTRSYPYQLRRWQPAQPVASYDSVRVVNNALYFPLTMRLASTVLGVDANLSPLSVRAEAGRQVVGKHLGYGGLVPVLQVANAQASEVIFSDFEAADKPYCFVPANGSAMPSWSPDAAHTGNQGCVLPAGSGQTTKLPTSTAPQYWLVFWARSTAAASGDVTVQPATTPAIAIPFTCNSQWQRYEMLLPLGNLASRSDYQLAITANAGNSVALLIDDILLLPTEAAAASTTYSLATGKTSETDARGRTTYYEYAPTGDLARVRDHNQAIEHQYQKVMPGLTIQSGISFSTAGLMQENKAINFSALATLSGPLEYKWDFGDNTTTAYATYSASPQAQHSYLMTGQRTDYPVRLTVRSQGAEYQYTQNVSVAPTPLVLTTCTGGVVSINDCNHHNGTVNQGCNPNTADQSATTTFQVFTNLSGVTYQWEFYDDTRAYSPGWEALTANSNLVIAGAPTSAAITVDRACPFTFRCRVIKSPQEEVSEPFAINHYRADLSCP